MPSTNVGTKPKRPSPNAGRTLTAVNVQLLRDRVTALGATEAERLVAAGISRNMYFRLLRGETGLTIADARDLCRRLEVTLDELFPDEQASGAGDGRAA